MEQEERGTTAAGPYRVSGYHRPWPPTAAAVRVGGFAILARLHNRGAGEFEDWLQAMDPTVSPSSEDDLRARFDARFRAPLMSFFLRRVGNRAEAEDLTQDVFLNLLGAGHNHIRDADAFVFKIAGNLLRDRGRRSATRNNALLAEIDEHLVSELTREFMDNRNPERTLIARGEVAEVLAALDELGERTKDIFVLFRLEAIKQREIANMFGLTVKSVEKHIMRASLHLALRFGTHR